LNFLPCSARKCNDEIIDVKPAMFNLLHLVACLTVFDYQAFVSAFSKYGGRHVGRRHIISFAQGIPPSVTISAPTRTPNPVLPLHHLNLNKANAGSCALVVDSDTVRVGGRDGMILFDQFSSNMVVSPHVSNGEDSEACAGLMFGLNSSTAAAMHDIVLGRMKAHKILAVARIKRWWMAPSWPSSASSVPLETQFLLAQLTPDGPYVLLLPMTAGSFRGTLYGEGGREALRCCPKSVDETEAITLKLESGDKSHTASQITDALYVAAGPDPFELITRGFAQVADHLGTFRVRSAKKEPALLRRFGWCTWDAFYSDVTPEGVDQGLEALAEGGTPARFLVLDDGWQQVHDRSDKKTPKKSSAYDKETKQTPLIGSSAAAVLSGERLTGMKLSLEAAKRGIQTSLFLKLLRKYATLFYSRYVEHAPPDSIILRIWTLLCKTIFRKPLLDMCDSLTDFTKRLGDVKANSKFHDPAKGETMGSFVNTMKTKFKALDLVYAWHALPGYWGGVAHNAPEMAHLEPVLVYPHPSPSVREIEPSVGWEPSALCGLGAVPLEHTDSLYQGIHGYLKGSGVDGVKVDVQAYVGAMGQGRGGGPEIVRKVTRSMEQSVSESFGAEHCLNCMCHSTENLYNYKETSLIRASDDFYPKEAAAQSWHVVAASFNSLFIGEVGYTDWDMFHSNHHAAQLHATARAVSGGPIYTSDSPNKHDFPLLRTLVLPDGSIPAPLNPGRPTADSLFMDPSGHEEPPHTESDQGRAYKIWNTNHHSFVIGAFNLRGSNWNRRTRMYHTFDEDPGPVMARITLADIPALKTRPSSDDEEPSVVVAYSPNVEDKLTLLRSPSDAMQFKLDPLEAAVVTLVPALSILDPRGGSADNEIPGANVSKYLSWAPIGLAGMRNAGGTILSQEMSHCSDYDRTPLIGATVEVCQGHEGEVLLAWASRRPRVVTLTQRSEGGAGLLHEETIRSASTSDSVPFEYDPTSGLLEVG